MQWDQRHGLRRTRVRLIEPDRFAPTPFRRELERCAGDLILSTFGSCEPTSARSLFDASLEVVHADLTHLDEVLKVLAHARSRARPTVAAIVGAPSKLAARILDAGAVSYLALNEREFCQRRAAHELWTYWSSPFVALPGLYGASLVYP